MSKKKVGVILSGCGVRDGSEIHESVGLLIHLVRAGFEPVFMAPGILQRHTVDHLSGEVTVEKRHVHVESARIARGPVMDLSEVEVDDYVAFMLPGGFGAVTNLCDFADRGIECEVIAPLRKLLEEAHEAGKVLGFMCIAPVIAARVFGRLGVRVTIGSDKKTAEAIEAMGARHIVTDASGHCVDERHLLISVPAYMEARDICECYDSAGILVDRLIELLS